MSRGQRCDWGGVMGTYDRTLDEPRLTSLRDRVLLVMGDGRWRTLGEIQARTGGAETGVSAKLRDLRKAQFGAHCVESRRRGNPRHGVWEYRLVARGVQLEIGNS